MVLIWAFPCLPTQDGPSHVHNSRVLAELGASDGGFLESYYQRNESFVTPWLVHWVLGGLQAVFAPRTAEKLLASAYIVLLPLSMLFALRSIRPESGFLALLVLPFVLSYPFHMGFYPFCLSLAGYLLVFGCWLRIQKRRTRWSLLFLALLVAGLYLVHPFSLLMLFGGLGLLCVWAMALRAVGSGEGNGAEGDPWRCVDGRALASLVVFVPAVAAFARFMAEKSGEVFYDTGFVERGDALLHLASIVSFLRLEKIAGGIVVVLFLVVVLLRLGLRLSRPGRSRPGRSRPKLRIADGLLVVAVAYCVLYFAAPDATTSGQYIPERIMLYVFLMLILWLGSEDHSPAARRLVVWAGTMVVLAILAMHGLTYWGLNDYLEEYLSVTPRVEPGTTLLALSLDHPGAPSGGPPRTLRVRPFLHAAERIAAEKPVIVFPNYQPAVSSPTVWRRGLTPYANIGLMEAEPPRVEFLHYQERSGRQLDYVLLWGSPGGDDEHPNVQFIYRQLDAGYELIYTSPQRGLARLYRQRRP